MKQQTVPRVAYGIFMDDVNQANVSRAIGGITSATNNGTKEVHLMLQTTGGLISDAVAFHSFFCALVGTGIDLTLYNTGYVASAGITVFLGAKKRVASPHSMFMIHRSTWGTPGAAVPMLENQARMLQMEDDRSFAIWRDYLKLLPEKWMQIEQRELWLTPADALECGLATEIGEFAPPPGTPIGKV